MYLTHWKVLQLVVWWLGGNSEFAVLKKIEKELWEEKNKLRWREIKQGEDKRDSAILLERFASLLLLKTPQVPDLPPTGQYLSSGTHMHHESFDYWEFFWVLHVCHQSFIRDLYMCLKRLCVCVHVWACVWGLCACASAASAEVLPHCLRKQILFVCVTAIHDWQGSQHARISLSKEYYVEFKWKPLTKLHRNRLNGKVTKRSCLL